MRCTTLKELAKILDCSVSTISKALNDSDEISLATKAKVKSLADLYGYVPNTMAKNFRLGRTRTIGVIVPNLIDEFLAMVFHGIEREASRLNYKVVVCISNDEAVKEKEGLISLNNGSVDGILISLAKETQLVKSNNNFKLIDDSTLPIVLFNRVDDTISRDKITIDNFDGSYAATRHLIQTGCKSIAFLSTLEKIGSDELSREGYLQALKLESSEQLKPIFINMDKYCELRKVSEKTMHKNKVDAILAEDDLSVYCAMNLVQAVGLKVPDDVSIIGLTDGKLANYSTPRLTTVSLDVENIGKKAVNTLIKRIEKTEIGRPSYTVIKSELKVRNSTKALAET